MNTEIARLPKEAYPKSWIMKQNWEHLLFLHWPIQPKSLQHLIPGNLEIDTFQGDAWISIVPFQVSGVRLRFMPMLPAASTSLQINVRTYVKEKNTKEPAKPGVYFFSLDVSNALAVYAARLLYRLPCYRADMYLEKRHDWFTFQSSRSGVKPETERFIAQYRLVSGPFSSEAGSLDHWLTERYIMYCSSKFKRKPRIYTGEVFHQSWKLYHAEASIDDNSMTKSLYLEQHDMPVIAHYARGVQALISPLRVWKS